MKNIRLNEKEIQFLFDWFKSSIAYGDRMNVNISTQDQIETYNAIIQRSGIKV